MIGLARGTVKLYDHEKEWEDNAALTIEKLKSIFGAVATDIQHVGSTSIVHIKAKPIIDIAVAVKNFDDVYTLVPPLEKVGFVHSPDNDNQWQVFFICGNMTENTRTHHIHIVKTGGKEWTDYINFRDYLNAKPEIAKEYEAVKLRLMSEHKTNRLAYTEGKAVSVKYILRKELVWSYLGKTITVAIDRPIGSVHPKHSDMIYPINYGYIENVIGGDGEELDVYVLGVNKPIEQFTGKVIAIVHREDDIEDKLVATPKGMKFTAEQIKSAVEFQEKYYRIHLEEVK